MNISALPEFSSAVHANILVGVLWGVTGKPTVDPVDRWGLGCEGAAEDSATEMVGEEDVACFAVEADKIVVSGRIATLLNHETEVNG
jgi:hypothetical protein